MQSLLFRLLNDDGGQDLVEYALLTTAVALAAALALSFLQNALGTAYSTYTADAGPVNSIWESPAPSGGS